jgi:hypothetical protein
MPDFTPRPLPGAQTTAPGSAFPAAERILDEGAVTRVQLGALRLRAPPALSP